MTREEIDELRIRKMNELMEQFRVGNLKSEDYKLEVKKIQVDYEKKLAELSETPVTKVK